MKLTQYQLYIVIVFIGTICCSIFGTSAYDPSGSETLNVYVVPHSHNDPGWWNTFEDYYTSWTRGIITSIVQVLGENKDRRFIWAEISFFQRWWTEQNQETKDLVKKLVDDKQLEFVTGGWVMNDEAGTHLIDIINQLTEGHEWLYNTLGVKPTVGWSIDPFGHSSSMPYVLQQMGFKSMVINRIHKDRKAEFRNTKGLEFFWQNENNVAGPKYNIQTHVFPWKLYDIPNTCGPDWDTCARFDFERDGVAIPITPHNVAERSKTLVNMYKQKAAFFRHNHVLIPLGDDFKYKTYEMTRKIMTQYEMLFEQINRDKSLNVNIRFSTLSDYLNAVADWEAENHDLPTFKGDFFTYCDEDQDYWSGYFTTRPFMKGLTRTTQSVLRNGEALYALEQAVVGQTENIDGRKKWFHSIEVARSNLGIFQHHDGVTGTARVRVVADYAKRLQDSLWGVAEAATKMVTSLLAKQPADRKLMTSSFVWSYSQPQGLMLLPAPRVLPGNGMSVVVVYNSLQNSRKEVISLFVGSHKLKVMDANQQEIKAQIDPVWSDSDIISDNKFLLHFVAKVPALGFSTYFVTTDESSSSVTRATVNEYQGTESKHDVSVADDWNGSKQPLTDINDVSIRNQQYTVTFRQGGIKNIRRAVKDQELNVAVKHEFLSYNTHRSGAYLFLPNGPASNPLSTTEVRLTEGPLVNTAVYLMPNGPVKEFVVRLYNCESGDKCTSADDMIEIIHTLDLDRKFGNHEVITRYTTDLSNENKFYTDSNGLDMRQRTYVSSHPIQSNYYPITAAAYLEDSQTRLTLLSHEAHGVGSLATGSIEVMLDRRLNQDDARGLGEPVTDNCRTTIPLWLILEPASSIPALTPTATSVWQSRNYPLQQFYTKDPISDVKDYVSSHHLVYAPLRTALPSGVQLMTFAPRNDFSDEILLRVYVPPSTAATSTSEYSLDLDMFSKFKPIKIQDVTLSMMYGDPVGDDFFAFTLKSSEIKTFTFGTDGIDDFMTEEDTLPTFDEAPLVEATAAPRKEVAQQPQQLPQLPDKVEETNEVVVSKNDDKGGEMRVPSKDVPPISKQNQDGFEDVDPVHHLPRDEAVPQPGVGGDGNNPINRPPPQEIPRQEPKREPKPPPENRKKFKDGQRPNNKNQKVNEWERDNGAFNNKNKDNNDETTNNKPTNLYAVSLMLYLGMAVCMFVSGYLCRSKKGFFSSWGSKTNNSNNSNINNNMNDREQSVMKML